MDEPLSLDPSATHAGRNPSRELLPPRTQPKKKKTAAEKREAKLRKAQAQEKADRLADEIENYLQQEEQEVATIAERTGYSTDHVRRVLKTSGLKQARQRNATPHNAMVSYKIKKLNEGEPIMSQYCLNIADLGGPLEIPANEKKVDVAAFAKMAAQDPSIKELTEAEQEEAMEALLAKRKVDKVGVRGTTRGVTLQGLAAMGKIGDMVSALRSLHRSRLCSY